MSQVFIAYSRTNRDLALLLKETLQDAGYDVWIDLEDLPASSVWRLEIKEAIEGCIAFIYLLSSESISSKYCQDEFKYARELNKKIIPILLSGMNDINIPSKISEIQWLQWEDFAEKLSNTEKLQEIVDLDIAWAKFHAELTEKVKKWERRKKDKSRLLRGKELREVQNKLAETGSEAAPQVTDLQRQYVLSSRKNEEQQRRRTIIGLGFGLVIVAILAIIAWTQRNSAIESDAVAQEEKNRAEEQTEISLARSLTDKSNSLGMPEAQLFTYGDNRQVAGNYTISVLLAIESIKRVPTSEGAQALLSKIEYLPNVIAKLDDNKSFEPYSQTIYVVAQNVVGTVK